MFNNSNVDSNVLLRVKNALGITGNFQDNTIEEYIKEVLSFVKSAGVKENNVTIGLITRGVADLWNYGSNDGKLSTYFIQRVTQLALLE